MLYWSQERQRRRGWAGERPEMLSALPMAPRPPPPNCAVGGALPLGRMRKSFCRASPFLGLVHVLPYPFLRVSVLCLCWPTALRFYFLTSSNAIFTQHCVLGFSSLLVCESASFRFYSCRAIHHVGTPVYLASPPLMDV